MLYCNNRFVPTVHVVAQNPFVWIKRNALTFEPFPSDFPLGPSSTPIAYRKSRFAAPPTLPIFFKKSMDFWCWLVLSLSEATLAQMCCPRTHVHVAAVSVNNEETVDRIRVDLKASASYSKSAIEKLRTSFDTPTILVSSMPSVLLRCSCSKKIAEKLNFRHHFSACKFDSIDSMPIQQEASWTVHTHPILAGPLLQKHT